MTIERRGVILVGHGGIPKGCPGELVTKLKRLEGQRRAAKLPPSAEEIELAHHVQAMKRLQAYGWPGNIRQLQHMMERLTILAPGGKIDEAAVRGAVEQMDSRDAGSETLADTEADQIRRVLGTVSGNKSRAAKILGIERKTLYRKLERMGL